METAEVLAARLRSNPADQEAYEALKALYRNPRRPGSLVNLIAGWAGWVPDDRAASSAYIEVARSARAAARRRGAGGGVLPRGDCGAIRSTPQRPKRCKRCGKRTGEFTASSPSSCRSRCSCWRGSAPAPRQLAVLRYRLGELWSKRFGRSPEALHHYRKAFELDPSLLRAMYEARQLYLADGDMRAAAELYDREAAAEANPERRVALLLELAALYRDELNDFDGAVSALQRAHGLMPGRRELGLRAGLAADPARRARRRAHRAGRLRADGGPDVRRRAARSIPSRPSAISRPRSTTRRTTNAR